MIYKSNRITNEVTFCNNCTYPSSSAVPLIFDEKGICSGCNVSYQSKKIDWDKRWNLLIDFVKEYTRVARNVLPERI